MLQLSIVFPEKLGRILKRLPERFKEFIKNQDAVGIADESEAKMRMRMMVMVMMMMMMRRRRRRGRRKKRKKERIRRGIKATTKDNCRIECSPPKYNQLKRLSN